MSDTAVLVHVPEAEPVVGHWRLQHTYDAPRGIPPHVTLLFPWIPVEELTEEAEERLARMIGEAEPFEVAFARAARWPDVLYLEPDPSEPFTELTGAIAAEWPEHPPYEGGHEIVMPHLTVAEGEDDLLEWIRVEVEPQLPVQTRIGEAKLYTEDETGRWHERSRLPFA